MGAGQLPVWRRTTLRIIPDGIKLLAGNYREIRELAGLFRRHPVDVLHVNVSGYEMAGTAAERVGMPSVAVYHTYPERQQSMARQWLIGYAMRSFKWVGFPAIAVMEAWLAIGRAKPRAGGVLRYGIDVARFAVSRTRIPRLSSDPFHVVSIGRLHWMKGFKYLIEAAGHLADPRLIVDIYGTGDEDAALSKQIHDLGLEGRVFLRGHVEDVDKRLSGANAMVLASVAFEACPFVLLEAMAASLPLVTSNFGALPEVNIDGETGFVTPMHDSLALASAIRRLMDNPPLALRMGQLGLQRVKVLYSREQMVRSALDVYTACRRFGEFP